MEYTAYKFQPSFIEERLKSYKSNLMKFKGHDDLVGSAVRVIRERLESDPRRYLSYGPLPGGPSRRFWSTTACRSAKVDDEEVEARLTPGDDRRGDHRDGRGVQPNPPGTLASMTWTTLPMPRQSILADR